MVRVMAEKKAKSEPELEEARPMCGIIRPIAPIGDYSSSHWRDVHEIVADAAVRAGYQPRLVSESDAAGVILSEIITNIYNDPIVVCDVSGKNPNVMFELGLRMAFEKPVIIIADDNTDFSFDISPVKHIKYPKTLRYQDIKEFKELLSTAIKATVAVAASSDYRGYLQQFGPIQVTKLEIQNIAIDSLGQELIEIKRAVQALSASPTPARTRTRRSGRGALLHRLVVNMPEDKVRNIETGIDTIPGYVSDIIELGDDKFEIKIYEWAQEVTDPEESESQLRDIIDKVRRES
jgi:hypothetical protein